MNLNSNHKATNPTVSVIIPSYNYANFLPEAVESIFNQTFQDFEVIVVDDGSTDNTQEVVQTFADRERFHYIYLDNQGLAATRNTGLRAAKGEFIAFLDADDIILPNKLDVQVNWLRNNPDYGLVGSGYYYMDEHGVPIEVQRPWLRSPYLNIKDLLFDCPFIVHAILVKKEWVDKVGGFDSQLRRVEDWDLWIRMAYAGCKMGWVEEIVCAYRMFPGQMTRNAAAQKKVTVSVMNKFFDQPELPDSLLALKSDVLTRVYLVCAGREYGADQCDDAQESIAEAVRLTPTLATTRQDELIDSLLSWTSNPFVGDPIKYTRRVFDNLPDNAAAVRQKKRWALGEIGLRMLFSAKKTDDWSTVRRAGQIVAVNAPNRMWNRGVFSIIWQSIKNKPTHQW